MKLMLTLILHTSYNKNGNTISRWIGQIFGICRNGVHTFMNNCILKLLHNFKYSRSIVDGKLTFLLEVDMSDVFIIQYLDRSAVI